MTTAGLSLPLSCFLSLGFLAGGGTRAPVFLEAPAPAPEALARLESFAGETVLLRDWSYSLQEGFRGKRREGSFRLDPGMAWLLSLRSSPDDGGETQVHGTLGEAPLPRYGFFALRSGGILEGSFLGGAKGRLKFKVKSGNVVEVPLEYLAGFRRKAVLEVPSPKPGNPGTPGKRAKGSIPKDANFARAMASPPLESDLCFYQRGKDEKGIRRIPCKVLGGTEGKARPAGLLLRVAGRERSLPVDKIYGLVLAEGSGIEAVAPKGVAVDRARLANGTTLEGRLLSAGSGKPWVFQTLEGFKLVLEPGLVREVEFGSPKVHFVSQMPGVRITQTATLDRKWPVLKDRAPSGKALKLGRHKFRHGFWLVPNQHLEIPVEKKEGFLLGKVGLVSRGKGLVTLRLLLDGKPLLEGLALKAGEEPVALRYKLGGAQRLTLELKGSFMLDSGAAVILGDLRILEQ